MIRSLATIATLVLVLVAVSASRPAPKPVGELAVGSPLLPGELAWVRDRDAEAQSLDSAEPDPGYADRGIPASTVSGVPSSRTALGLGQPRRHRAESPVPRPTARPAPSRKPVARKVTRPTPQTDKRVVSGPSGSLSGLASWYCLAGRSACTTGYGPDCACAAAGPAIRAALGSWRGRVVTVSNGRASAQVRLVDWCACPGGRVLDLYAYPFGMIGSLSDGLMDVTVDW